MKSLASGAAWYYDLKTPTATRRRASNEKLAGE
jgi:hypothetical protein